MVGVEGLGCVGSAQKPLPAVGLSVGRLGGVAMGLALELNEGGTAGGLGGEGVHHRLGASRRDDLVVRAVTDLKFGLDVPGFLRVAGSAHDEGP